MLDFVDSIPEEDTGRKPDNITFSPIPFSSPKLKPTPDKRKKKKDIKKLEAEILELINVGQMHQAINMLKKCSTLIQDVYDEHHPQQIYINYLTSDCYARIGEV